MGYGSATEVDIRPLTRFILPRQEIEVKSPWRRDFEAYLAAEKLKPKRVVPAEVKGKQESGNLPTVRAERRVVAIKKKSPCRPTTPRPHCSICDKVLKRNNSYGLCGMHYAQYRRSIHRKEPHRCEICQKSIRRHSRFPLCEEHGREQRRAVEYDQNRERLARKRLAAMESK